MDQRRYLAISFFYFFSFLSYLTYGRDLHRAEGGIKIAQQNTSISHLSTIAQGRNKWSTNLDGKVVGTKSTGIVHWAFLTTSSSRAGYYFGVKATLSVYSLPFMYWAKGKSSETKIWVEDESEGAGIQAGWHVMPELYNDNDVHFFVRWTANQWQIGCYNLHCDGFVQDKSSIIVPGSIIRPLSTYNGDQYEMTLKLRASYGNWELTYGPNADKPVGYFPGHLFTDLAYCASTITIGGESTNGGHFGPPMGSGHFAAAGQKKAAYIRDIEFVDGEGYMFRPEPGVLSFIQDDPNCYTIDGNPSSTVYYGGPGNCKN